MDDLAFAIEFKVEASSLKMRRRTETFLIDFQSIPNFEELPCTAATRSIVASKNRFLNILPIDATRVILNKLNDDPATDYINGNYISVRYRKFNRKNEILLLFLFPF